MDTDSQKPPTKSPPKWKHFWLGCRWCVRGVRVAGLLTLLAGTIGFVWFNSVGLPNFLKAMVQEELKERGLEVQFQRMYWKWFQGIVTEDLTIGPSDGKIGPSIYIHSADVDLDLNALRRMELQINSIELFQGSGSWSIEQTNLPPKRIGIQNLFTDIRFLPDDQWELTRFSAEVQGIQVDVSGLITNASLLQPKRTAPGKKAKSPKKRRRSVEKLEMQIYDALREFEKYEFVSPPELTVELRADARDKGEVDARINGWARSLKSPLGSCRDFRLNGEVKRGSETNSPVTASLTISATHVETQRVKSRSVNAFAFATLKPEGDWQILWNAGLKSPTLGSAVATHVGIEGTASCDAVNTNHIRANVSLESTDLEIVGVSGETMKLSASVEGIRDRRLIESVSFNGNAFDVVTPWATAQKLSFNSEVFTNHVETAPRPDWNGTVWEKLKQLRGKLHLHATDLTDDKAKLASLDIDAEWRSPRLRLGNIEATFADSEVFTIDGILDASSRFVTGKATSTVHPDRITHLLSDKDRRYLSQYQFTSAPDISAQVTFRMFEWLDTNATWKSHVQPTLRLAARLSAKNGGYRGVQFIEAHTDLTLTNRLMVLPNLTIKRKDGPLDLTYTNDMATRDYQFGIRSRIDPRAVGTLLGKGERTTLAHITLSNTMPVIEGVVWGRWGDLTRTGVRAKTVATNISIRAQHFDWLRADIDLTNQFITVTNIAMGRPEGELHCPKVEISIPGQRVWISNAVSELDFLVIPKIIGPITARAVAPYQFQRAPKVLINGSVGTHRRAEKDSDLHFEMRGPQFHWFKFNLENTRATVHWVTNQLWISNLTSDFHGGSLAGDLWFDFDPPVGNDFTFDLAFTNTGFQSLIADVANPSNKLAGTLSGVVSVTNANTAYWDSWQGGGSVALTNGLLWDMKVFGAFSPLLNSIIPGLGSSKAKEASGNFAITNSIVHTGDLIIHSPPARLYYDGIVDFDANIDARVEAKLFKNKFLVGQILDLVTQPFSRIFEYKVTGTLADPKSEPLNVAPKLLLAPFNLVRDIVKPAANSSERKPGSDRR